MFYTTAAGRIAGPPLTKGRWMAWKYLHRRRVEFAETDMAGILHFACFYIYMEQAEHAFLRSLGLSVVTPDGDGTIGWPRVSASCSFYAPAFFEDVLDVRLLVERKGVKSLTFGFQFVRDSERLAKGRLKTCCCRVRPGQPMQSIPLPPAFDERIQEAPPEARDFANWIDP